MGSNRERRSDLLGVAALALTLASGACSSPRSFVILDLELAPGAPGPITHVGAVRVHVTQGSASVNDLTFKVTAPASGLVIDAFAPGGDAGTPTDAGGTPTDAGGTPADAGSTPADAGSAPADAGMVKTLSVDFSSTVTGTVSFDVDTIDTSGCIVGQGHTDVVIRKGAVAEGSVALTPQPPHDCNGDGGSPDGSPDASDGGPTFPGCDPMSPQTGAGLQCATGQVCQVDCPLNKTDCVQGGTGVPGSTCRNNADCAPGTQCFDYSTLGCMGTKVCLEFCGATADCAAFGAGGGGSGSLCEGPVQCGATQTTYHTCTFNCDPTAAAAATHGGCPDKLVCVMPASMDAVDCACPETTRTKLEGQACTGAADCAPGLICNQMNGTKICRPICRCQAVNGACTVGAGTCPTATTTCHPVTNDTLFGVCY
jgi:hypothetical protein